MISILYRGHFVSTPLFAFMVVVVHILINSLFEFLKSLTIHILNFIFEMTKERFHGCIVDTSPFT